MAPITANSVLPADRRFVEFTADDGTTLRGELSAPGDGAAVGTIVAVHPLTTHRGSMESHLIRKMSWRLPAQADLAVLRFNLRGAGTGERRSEGAFDSARGEGLDLSAALRYCADASLPPVWLVGWSFGTDIVLRHGNVPSVAGAILLSPPFRFATDDDLTRWAATGKPLRVMVPEHDDFLRPPQARQVFEAVPQAELIAVDGAQHLWVGERYVRIVLNEIVGAINPAAAPLPDEWAGPMERWSDL